MEEDYERYIVIETFELKDPFILSDKDGKPLIFKTEKEAEKAIYEHNCIHAIILDI